MCNIKDTIHYEEKVMVKKNFNQQKHNLGRILTDMRISRA